MAQASVAARVGIAAVEKLFKDSNEVNGLSSLTVPLSYIHMSCAQLLTGTVRQEK